MSTLIRIRFHVGHDAREITFEQDEPSYDPCPPTGSGCLFVPDRYEALTGETP